MQEKILFVDDEPSVLQGYQRLLRGEFNTDTAVGGKGALIAYESTGPYAVVVSDMQMPGMTGLELLREFKRIAPDTVRIMLTGHAQMEAAIAAVNEGNIFRFLTKPCDKETLGKALNAALVQHRLVRAERDLLEDTLKASTQVLSDVLSLVNPAAFGRAMRVRRYMSHIVNRMGLPRPWRFEVAAMMSQLGCVVLAPETIDAVFSGKPLSPEEQARYNSHPEVARGLLENIPRLEPIAWMIAHQNRVASVESDISDREMADMRLGAEILQVAVAFDDLIRKGISRVEAANRLMKQHRDLDQKVLFALVELDPEKEDAKPQQCPVEKLTPGLVLAEDIYSTSGSLIVTKGQEVTAVLIMKFRSLQAAGSFTGPVMVVEPKQAAQEAKTAAVAR